MTAEEKRFEALKVAKWYDRKSNKILYGVDCKIKGRWYHLKDENFSIVKTEHEAAQKIKELCLKENMIV